MVESSEGYIVRLSQDKIERQLFVQRELFVGVKRNWLQGTRTLFVKRVASVDGSPHDQFIASGVIQDFVDQNQLEGEEKRKCAENNWYGKVVYESLMRMLPPVAVEVALEVGKGSPQRNLLQTGTPIKNTDIDRIERLANIRIWL